MAKGLLKKTFVLILLSILLFATFMYTNSLAVLSDALYAIVDAAYVFSLWAVLTLLDNMWHNKFMRKVTAIGIFLMSLMLVLASSLMVYTSFLSLIVSYTVQNPLFIIAAELLYIFVLLYIYASLREGSLREDVRAMAFISRDVETNIIASIGVIIAALFVMVGMPSMDAIVASLISVYLLYKALRFSFLSFRTLFGSSDPLVEEAIKFRAKSMGVRLNEWEVFGIGPFYIVDISIDVSHLPDSFERVEMLLRRRIEELLPSTAKVIIREG